MRGIKQWLTVIDGKPHQILREEALRVITLGLIITTLTIFLLMVMSFMLSNPESNIHLAYKLPILAFMSILGLAYGVLTISKKHQLAGFVIILTGTLSANLLLLIDDSVFPVASIGLEITALTMAALTLPRRWHWYWVPVQISLYSLILLILNLTDAANLNAVVSLHNNVTPVGRLHVALSGIVIRSSVLVLEAFILDRLISIFEKMIAAEVRVREEVERNYQNSTLLLQKAQERNRLKDQFFANISHELNTPLNAMLGSSTLLLHDKVKDTSLQKEHLKSINEATRRLQSIVQSLLDYNLVDHKQLKLQVEQIDLEIIAQSAINRFTILAKDKNLDLVLDNKLRGTIFLYTDRIKLSQILDNLLNNALKFTTNGEVRLSIYKDKVVIADTGIGIPIEDQKYIFDPFQRAHLPIEWQQQGTGLGLYICKEFSDAMGLKLTCISQLEQGTQMILQYPQTMTRLQSE